MVARDQNGRFVAGGPPGCGMKPGETRNPAGSSEKARFRAAVRRALKRRMRATLEMLAARGHELTGEEDELDTLAEEVVELAHGRDKTAGAILKEVWAREDGPLQTRLAGPDGEAIAPLVLFGVDAEAMRKGVSPNSSGELPSAEPDPEAGPEGAA